MKLQFLGIYFGSSLTYLYFCTTKAKRIMKKGVLMLVLAVLTTLFAKAQEEIITEPARKDTIRLLTIGNSFSQDAVEQYLYELADEVGIHMIIGNAYKGGQSLEQHWSDLTLEHDVYDYRKVVNGIRTNTPHALLPPIITDEPWDFISFQQASHYRYSLRIVLRRGRMYATDGI